MSVLVTQLDGDEAEVWRTDAAAAQERERAKLDERIRNLEERLRAVELRLEAVRRGRA